MTNTTNSPTVSSPLAKRMLIGGAIGFVLIAVFLLQVPDPNPEWGKLWMLKPLIVVPLATAMGAVFYHLVDPLQKQGAWKIGAILLSLIVFVISLWLGTVLGLNGTLWN